MTKVHNSLARFLLARLMYSKPLYAICSIIFLGTWQMVALCAYIFLASTGIAEWVKTGFALAIVGSSFALIYILLVIIPDHIWRKDKQ